MGVSVSYVEVTYLILASMRLAVFFAMVLFTVLLLAGCKSSKVICAEKPCTEACHRMYQPVCGCNNKTYSNACVAECHGITEYKEGPCETDK